MGVGRGELIEPLNDFDEQFMLIVTPKIRVSTREAYKRINASALTKEASDHILRVCRLEAESLDLRHSGCLWIRQEQRGNAIAPGLGDGASPGTTDSTIRRAPEQAHFLEERFDDIDHARRRVLVSQ